VRGGRKERKFSRNRFIKEYWRLKCFLFERAELFSCPACLHTGKQREKKDKESKVKKKSAWQLRISGAHGEI
jgi:hypothetical protein